MPADTLTFLDSNKKQCYTVAEVTTADSWWIWTASIFIRCKSRPSLFISEAVST